MLLNQTAPLPNMLSVRALILRPILAHFAEDVGAIEILLHRNGLSRDVLSEPYAPIPLLLYLNIFEQAAELAQDPLLGARLGCTVRTGSLSAYGYRAALASSIRRGFEALSFHMNTIQSGALVTLSEDEEFMRIGYRITAPIRVECRQDTEFTIAVYCGLIRQSFNAAWRPVEVHFTHRAPRRGKRELARMFGAPVLFSQPSNCIVMTREDADRHRHDEDPEMIAVMERHLLDQRGVFDPGAAVSEQVEALIALYLGVKPVDLETISAALQIGVRSLQRLLDAEGVSFRDLLKRHRMKRAAELLRDSHLSIGEIATTLGYTDSAAFWRAYRSWSGETPRKTRKQARPPA